MNYSKIEYLRKENKVTIPELAEKIGMSKSGFEKMMRERSCKVSTLESIAAYFCKPIVYFFDEDDTKEYPKNALKNTVEEPALKTFYNTDEKDGIIERQDRFIQSLESTIKLLIEKIGNEMVTDNLNKTKKLSIRGFNKIDDPNVKSILNNLFANLQAQ
jgi:transcriptional regulator with XRE-family HTH domain